MGWFSKKERPPSNDPGRPPKGPGSGSVGKPRPIEVHITVTTEEAKHDG
jgi:hypothetical protein